MEGKNLIVSKKAILALFTKIFTGSKLVRKIATKKFEKVLYKSIVERDDPLYNKKGLEDRYNGVVALFRSALRNFDRGLVSKELIKKMINVFVGSVWLDREDRTAAIKAFEEKYGQKPPMFITLAPTKKCNLKCIGCYASSDSESENTLEWSYVDKLFTELHDELGMRFFVITGGEPLLYKSEGKDILDLPRKWEDSYFLMYTNGTMITEEKAQEMAELGNITPAISIEGFEEQTDERRGKGIHKAIIRATEHLKKAGVPFGASVTSTSKNIDLLLEDKFYEYWFDEIGVGYMWSFQYMPIGREFTTDLMITPEERFKLYKQWRHITKDKSYFVADFWNSAILSDGCLSCGRERNGYFYIDWDGKIMPCVFVPYYKDTVQELIDSGRKVHEAIFSDLFIKGREWQTKHREGDGKLGNMLMPCFIRDHHKNFLKIARETNAKPEDEAAEAALKSEEYHEALIKYDEELAEITDPHWEKEYAKEEQVEIEKEKI